MKILALDTSTKAGSAAILEDENLIGEVYFYLNTTHSERILPIIDYILNFSKIKINEIDLFVSSIGPGSFTGIRIGLSLAKGFSFALNKPLIGISSLDALAVNYYFNNFITFIEARNGEFYYCEYERDKNLNLIKKGDYSIANIEDIPSYEIGIGIFDSLFKGIQENSNIDLPFNKIVRGFLKAYNFGILGYKKYCSGDMENDVNPLYLKPSDAEIKLRKSLDNKN